MLITSRRLDGPNEEGEGAAIANRRKESTGSYLAVPRSGRGPGVLVVHAWWGLNDFMRTVCDRLADLGFVALAPDLYHGRTASAIEEAEALRSTLKDSVVMKELFAAADDLRRRPGVADHPMGLLGFSLGAYYALSLACERGREFGGVVIYYGTGEGDFTKAQAAFLGHFAEKDPYESAAYVRSVEESLRAAGRNVTFHVYPGTGHWFFEDDRKDAYNPEAAALSWRRTTGFLRTRLG